jgi:hypothetical protein
MLGLITRVCLGRLSSNVDNKSSNNDAYDNKLASKGEDNGAQVLSRLSSALSQSAAGAILRDSTPTTTTTTPLSLYQSWSHNPFNVFNPRLTDLWH